MAHPGEPAASGRLVLQGGEVVDPASQLFGPADVAVLDGRIEEVDRAVTVRPADTVVDVSGCVVTPGLVDLHTHVYWGGTFWGVDPVQVAGRSGVTTWIDAGSAGAFTVEAFRRACVAGSPVRIKALLNVASAGLVTETGELRRPGSWDPALCAETIAAHRDLLVGVKCRLDTNTVGDHGVAPLVGALEAGEAAGVPVMVHIGMAPPDIDDVLDLLRPGDIVTHCSTGHSMRLLGDDGLRPSAARALARGVVLDVGHGYGGFSFPVAAGLLAAGAPPDVISSDAHQRSVRSHMHDLPTCLSKYLALGLSVPEVVAAATVRPAEVLGLADQVGSLAVGRRADIAVFALEEGHVVFYDVDGRPLEADRRLVNRLTLVEGRVLEPVPLGPVPGWLRAGL